MINDVKVIKRSGVIVKFDTNKILNAILASMKSVDVINEELAKDVTNNVVMSIDGNKEISVEEIQNLVEENLVKKQVDIKVIREYITYRWQRREVREYKESLGIADNDGVKLTPNALALLDERYLKVINGKKETPSQMFMRTAKHIAAVEKRYGDSSAKWAKTFYNMLANGIFFPNMPTLSNSACKNMNYLMSCYVLSVPDSIIGIFDTAKQMARIMKSGGGIGLNLSDIRPRNDVVSTTQKCASGVVGFLPIFNSTIDSIKQGGMRRGAGMALLRCDHPDILEFITCKQQEGIFSNLNLSVAITDSFMKAVVNDSDFPLINPRTKQKQETVKARYLLNLIAKSAWETGEPGVVFFDKYNLNNPTPTLGPMYKNACSETSLLPFEQCCLGSINLTKFVDGSSINKKSLGIVVHNAVRFLDNTIDATDYILPEIEQVSKGNRKIGLGIMGFADMLYLMKIPYDSEEAIAVAEDIMKFISIEVRKESEKLSIDRGSFPNFNISIYTVPIRNASSTVIAPTGEISILGNTSAGIEPNFGLVFKRQTTLAIKELITVNAAFEIIAKKEGFYSITLVDKIMNNGGVVRGIKEIPEEWKKVFVTALEVSPEYHIRVQSAFQKYIDNSISKTVLMPHDSSVTDIEKVILKAYELNCHGITVFRDGCRKQQVLSVGNSDCPECKTQLIFSEGCYRCPSCGWGRCSVNS